MGHIYSFCGPCFAVTTVLYDIFQVSWVHTVLFEIMLKFGCLAGVLVAITLLWVKAFLKRWSLRNSMHLEVEDV